MVDKIPCLDSLTKNTVQGRTPRKPGMDESPADRRCETWERYDRKNADPHLRNSVSARLPFIKLPS